jgi:hypothetical protein
LISEFGVHEWKKRKCANPWKNSEFGLKKVTRRGLGKENLFFQNRQNLRNFKNFLIFPWFPFSMRTHAHKWKYAKNVKMARHCLKVAVRNSKKR